VRVLVTRPEPDGERTAERLRARGCEVILSPLLRVEPVSAELGGAWDALALTSVNAVRAISKHSALPGLRATPLYAVGARTAEAARAQGFANVISADGNAGVLAGVMVTQLRPGARVLYLAGEDRAGDLAGALTAAGIKVTTCVVYRAVAARQFSSEARGALSAGTLDGALHFSRRTAEAYLACAGAGGLTAEALAPVQYCLSAQVAEPLAAAGACSIQVAERPTEAALIALVAG
jgi:uroporphyrinogen-III synthase